MRFAPLVQPFSPLYALCRFCLYVIFRLGWRFEAKGVNHIPSSGPVIIAANHRSYGDPPLAGTACNRELHYLAKKALFRFKPFGFLISRLNAHPLNRASGSGALKEAMDLLKAQNAVIVFPEGRRSKTDQLQPAKAGVGLLAKKTDSVVIPTYIHNSGHMIQFKKITVLFGKPLHPSDFKTYQDVADGVMEKIRELKDLILTG